MERTGFFLALGVFAGNFLFQGVFKDNIYRGLGIGGLAAIITMILWYSLYYWGFFR